MGEQQIAEFHHHAADAEASQIVFRFILNLNSSQNGSVSLSGGPETPSVVSFLGQAEAAEEAEAGHGGPGGVVVFADLFLPPPLEVS